MKIYTPQPVPATARMEWVTMRDGVRLATDYYPLDLTGEPTRRPVVLVRLPYDKNSSYAFMDQIAERCKRSGYVLVAQDVRGKFRSDGLTAGPSCEPNDGYDTIDWIARQPWCDGNVGMFGDSYYGLTQWAAASTAHPALKAIVPRVTSPHLATLSSPEKDGVRDVDWLKLANYIQQCWTDKGLNYMEPDWQIVPLVKAFDAVFEELGARSRWLEKCIKTPNSEVLDVQKWLIDSASIPTLHVVGWFDNCALRQMRDYMLVSAMPAGAHNQYLLADAIDHANNHISQPLIAEQDVEDPATSERLMESYFGPAIEFFDVFLKGGDRERLPRVNWHLAHAGCRVSAAWPPPESKELSMFLTHLDACPEGNASLAIEAPVKAATAQWTYDPQHLFGTGMRNSFAILAERFDESDLGKRSDVLVFESGAWDEALDIAGAVDLWIQVRSTAPTTDIFARLLDVDPQGAAKLIVRGEGEIVQPDGSRPVRIELGHTGYRLRPGHRLRLLVTSSDYPEFVPNTGVGGNRWTAEQRVASQQTLLVDPASPSRLSLRVVAAPKGFPV